MREILFRGKRVDSGGWVEGDLCQSKAKKFIVYDNDFYIMDCIGSEALQSDRFLEVLPETVGQFTGLTDKNGTKIFEGDILRNEKNMVYAGSYNFECIFENAAFVFLCEKYGVAAYSDDAENLEIIGNIHDNPELMEGQNET